MQKLMGILKDYGVPAPQLLLNGYRWWQPNDRFELIVRFHDNNMVSYTCTGIEGGMFKFDGTKGSIPERFIDSVITSCWGRLEGATH